MSEQEAYIWLSPARQGGAACIGGTRLPCRQMAEAWWDRPEMDADRAWAALAYQYPTLMRTGLILACWWVVEHAGRPWPARWGEWADKYGLALWKQNWAAVELPPRKGER